MPALTWEDIYLQRLLEPEVEAALARAEGSSNSWRNSGVSLYWRSKSQEWTPVAAGVVLFR